MLKLIIISFLILTIIILRLKEDFANNPRQKKYWWMKTPVKTNNKDSIYMIRRSINKKCGKNEYLEKATTDLNSSPLNT